MDLIVPKLVCERREPVVVGLERLRLRVQHRDPLQLPQPALGRRHAVPGSLPLNLILGNVHLTSVTVFKTLTRMKKVPKLPQINNNVNQMF